MGIFELEQDDDHRRYACGRGAAQNHYRGPAGDKRGDPAGTPGVLYEEPGSYPEISDA